ncbi:unnamed protein product [Nesidiocoris tenuis]|uniref:Uncharacterized protein n=1 Tax=Nesidiocoris tenuis TaxID=355587 RepID=A0A6H5HCH1_9HEMI|nr:unnamed protein product [Nesidiocoris tenuis]
MPSLAGGGAYSSDSVLPVLPQDTTGPADGASASCRVLLAHFYSESLPGGLLGADFLPGPVASSIICIVFFYIYGLNSFKCSQNIWFQKFTYQNMEVLCVNYSSLVNV